MRRQKKKMKEIKRNPKSSVTLSIEDGRVIIQPLTYNLEEMLKKINPKNQHPQLLDD